MKFMALILLGWLALPFSPVLAEDPAEEVITVHFETELGDITLELYPEKAPLTVANFMAYVDGGTYAGGSFYRVVRHDNDHGSPKITVIQGGANLADDEQPFPPVALERTRETGLSHGDGVVSMARGAPDSATHAFFITIGDNPGLDYGGARHRDGQGFAAFGRVRAGMDVVRAINGLTTVRKDVDPYVSGQILDPVVQIFSARRMDSY